MQLCHLINFKKVYSYIFLKIMLKVLGQNIITVLLEVVFWALSFYPTKILGCFGDGGAIVTNNKMYINAKNKKSWKERKGHVDQGHKQ